MEMKYSYIHEYNPHPYVEHLPQAHVALTLIDKTFLQSLPVLHLIDYGLEVCLKPDSWIPVIMSAAGKIHADAL
jgi:hypothetical protein